jgi:hypothetical protein
MEGLWLNIGGLEALEDVRLVNATGAVWGGESGRQYQETLQSAMWWKFSGSENKARALMRAALASKGTPSPSPAVR